ncbi:MAG: glycosyltransferase family 4 protein [Nanoarchaeota archaeon]
MKVINVSSIIPLKGLKYENDIILLIQNYLKKQYDFDFTTIKSLPYVNGVLKYFSKKWYIYFQYLKKGFANVNNNAIYIYPWLAPPTANIWINYFLLPFNWIYFRFKLLNKFRKFTQKSDIIVAQNIFPDAIISYWLHRTLKKPYILNIRGTFNSKILLLPYLNKVFLQASCLLTHSPSKYKELSYLKKITLIPHPIDSFFFFNKKDEFTELKLISVCRLLKLKNLDWVIKELALLNEEGYNFQYSIVGDGPEMRNLKSMTKKFNLEDKIIFYGFQDKEVVSSLLKQSNIFIMPSYPETLGRAFLEAAASDCICIGHRNTGIDGLFKNKESAIFVDRSDFSDELRNLFKNFSSDYVRNYLINSRKIVEQLTWENISKKYVDIYYNTAENTV